ncbi:YbaY family lipoprotein [Deinococcus sp.]|uniref:YbaY family lipoprotein n=1 Tax=Deinococcus sp. TaxID=47478 RepID=UPI0025D9B80F|nr:YbaY family lipoprotein [Deinococcus sp.]
MKTVSRFALAALLALPITAQAQTVINGVTITKPAPRPAPVQPAPVQPAPTGRRTVPAFVNEAIPADWIDVRGRVSAGAGRVDLPAGSRVTVALRDLSRTGAATIDTSFPSRSLPVSYQVVSSPRRFTASGNYAVQVQVVDSSGRVIYANATQYRINPAAKRILADVQVSPAR